VGYSMGGPVAQLLWRRHRDLVDGLVLCATSAGFVPHRLMRNVYQAGMLGATAMARLAWPSRLLPPVPIVKLPSSTMPAWAAAEMRRHDWRMIIEAGHSISTYSAHRWIGDVDVPTSIVCTTEDRGVAPSLQLATAQAIRGATVHSVADGHLACANARFADPLVAACLDVAGRAT
jgi:3-oxoadipate enol-lactonase